MVGISRFMEMQGELHRLDNGQQWEIGDTCVIGRHPGADVQIINGRVSREHAMLRRQGDGFSFYDLDSANGCRINGVTVSAPVQLHDGDRISIADIELVLAVGKPPGWKPHNPGEPDHMENATVMIGVQNVPMILLVADLKGYTSISKSLTEQELARLIGPWYEECRSLLIPSGATIDKFIGDCVFAYWRKTDPTTRAEALKAAKALAAHNLSVSEEHARMFQEKGISLDCGVGLHIGEAAVGAITRGNYTALGDAVNLTFRIEAETRSLNAIVLASAAFLDGWEAGASMFTNCGLRDLKGYSQSVEVYALKD